MKINKELLKGSTVILILSSLDQRPMYGYELMKELEKKSHGVFQFKEGTLYPILHMLESELMLEAYWSQQEGERKRKYYRITEKGKQLYLQKKEEWQVYRLAMEQIIGEGSPS